MAATIFDPGGCGCPAHLVTFRGCGIVGLSLTNYDLDIYDSAGGTLLESITTDAVGVASVSTTGTVWIASHDGRFSGQEVTFPAVSVRMTAIADDYSCRWDCAIPRAKTTYFTDQNGTWTLTYDEVSEWVGCGVNPALSNVIVGFDAYCNPVMGTGAVPYSITVSRWSRPICKWVITWINGPSITVAASSPFAPTCDNGISGFTHPASGCGHGWPLSLVYNVDPIPHVICVPFSAFGTLFAGAFTNPPNGDSLTLQGSWLETE